MSLLTRLAAALAVLPALATPALAAEYPAGSIAGASDYDVLPNAEAQRLALCYIEFQGDASPGPDEPVLLVYRTAANGVCPSSLSSPAWMMNNGGGRMAGTEVKPDDPWGVKALTSLATAHFVRYVEDGSDASKFDARDTLYLDLKGLATPRVDVGDIRITPFGALQGGRAVQDGDGDLNFPLADLRGAPRRIHDANVVYKAGSGFYVNADVGAIGGAVNTAGAGCPAACPVSGDFGVESGDVRLNAKAVNPLSDAPNVQVESVRLSSEDVGPGDALQAHVTVRNSGKGAGAGLMRTKLDGVAIDARGTPELAPGATATLVLTVTAPDGAGQHKLTVGETTVFFFVGPAAPDPRDGRIAALEARLAALEAEAPPANAAAGPAVAKAQAASLAAPAALAGLALAALVGTARRVR